jgi:hypothetical protein
MLATQKTRINSDGFSRCEEIQQRTNQKQDVEFQILDQLPPSPFVVAWVEQPLSGELLVNDSPGG